MTLSTEQLELPYFIPTSENVSQILSELRKAEKDTDCVPVRDRDFLLFRQRGSRESWRWEGIGQYSGAYSERNFQTEAEAEANAQAKLKQ